MRKEQLRDRATTVIDFAMAACGLFDSKATKKHVDKLLEGAK